MRFFIGACFFCLAIASVGCMTNNWTSPLFSKSLHNETQDEALAKRPGFFHQPFGKQAGIDDRAREIEKNLGYDY